MVVMIDRLEFGMLSPQMIKKMSALKLNNFEVYDSDGYPIDGGVMDSHMGVIDPGMRCKTCGGRSGECPGHFGYVELAKPVINILYLRQIKELLKFTCEHCGALLVNRKSIKEDFSNLSKLRPAKACPSCNQKIGVLKSEPPSSFRRDRVLITPEEIREQFEKIKKADAEALGVRGGRPEWMILTLLPIPSITTRPSITLTSGERSEDDLTHKLVDIIRINQRLANNLEIGAPEFILDDLWELVQYHITTYFNNEITGVPPARHRSGRQLKTLVQRLKAKDGRFRNNLTGKRVNFSARTIISPDPNISVNDVGVPEQIAMELTVPIRATKENIAEMKKHIRIGPNQPGGANYVTRPDGLRKKIADANKKDIIEELAEGCIVDKHISDGDIVLFNRQPSLHRMSMMAHTVKVMPGRTFRLNLSVCRPYNADFDGDEMNLHVPQTAEARAEAKELMLVEKHIRSPRSGRPIIGCVQDYLSGGYLLTRKNTVIPRELAGQLLASVGIHEPLEKRAYTGRELLSFIIPEGISMEFKAAVCENCDKCKKEKCENDAYVRIENGKMVAGVIDENAIAPFKGRLIDKIELELGTAACREFIEKVTRITSEFLMHRGFSISISDEDISARTKKDVDSVINKHLKAIERMLADHKSGKMKAMPGRTVEETLEDLVLIELAKIATEVQSLVSEKMPDNDALTMAITGARGSMQNLQMMAGLVGQADIRGRRVFRGYKKRTLPHFRKGDLSADAHGFVRSCYKIGLTPTEFFFEAMKGREGIMDSSLRTRISGYMYRRLSNAVQDLVVHKDNSVRDGAGTIIQFVVGEDGIDPSKSESGRLLKIR